MNKTKPIGVHKDITAICGYLKDEQKHYEESGRPQNHIWHSVKRTQEWLGNKSRAVL